MASRICRRYLHQNKMTLMNKQKMEEIYTIIPFLQAQNTESINIYRQTLAVYRANETFVQQIWKWYHNYANGWVNIMDKDPSNHLSMSKMFITYFKVVHSMHCLINILNLFHQPNAQYNDVYQWQQWTGADGQTCITEAVTVSNHSQSQCWRHCCSAIAKCAAYGYLSKYSQINRSWQINHSTNQPHMLHCFGHAL